MRVEYPPSRKDPRLCPGRSFKSWESFTGNYTMLHQLGLREIIVCVCVCEREIESLELFTSNKTAFRLRSAGII